MAVIPNAGVIRGATGRCLAADGRAFGNDGFEGGLTGAVRCMSAGASSDDGGDAFELGAGA